MSAKDRQVARIKRLMTTNYKRLIKIRLKELNTGGLSIYLDVWHNGKRQYQFLKLYLTGDPVADDNTIRLAMKIRDQKEELIKSQEYGFNLTNWKQNADFTEYFKAIAQKDPGRNWVSVANHFEKYHPGKVTFKQLTPQLFEGFKEYLRNNFHQNTAYLYLSIVKTALLRAVKEGIITTNPAQDVKIKPIQSKRQHLSLEEITKLENTPCNIPEVKRAFLFSCYSGLRYSDLVSLKWESIKDNTLTILQEKTDKLLVLPLLPNAIKLLGEPSRGSVFNMPSRTWGSIHLKNWISSAGIERDISWHSARHSFALIGLKYGTPLPVLQRLLGHSRIATTMRYLQFADKAVQDAVDQLSKNIENANRKQ